MPLSINYLGGCAGSGIDELFYGWQEAGFADPHYEVTYGPDRTTLTLPLSSGGREEGGNCREAPNSKLSPNETTALDLARKHGKVTTKDLTEATGLTRQAASVLLKRLSEGGALIWHGASKNDPRQYYSIRA